MIATIRDDIPPGAEPVTPPSPFSYFFFLLVVTLPCVGYLWYRRKQRHEHNFSLRDLAVRSRIARLAGAGGGVRLSTDGLPPAHEFLSNNASSDSLPTGVELPRISNTSPITAQALKSPSKSSHPAASLSEKSKIVPASPARRFMRRSRRQEGPVEPDDPDSADESAESEEVEGLEDAGAIGAAGKASRQEPSEPLFGIGDEPDPDSPTSSPGKSPRAR